MASRTYPAWRARLLASVAISAIAGAAQADPAPPIADQTASVQEVIVTATRQEASLGKVPESVSAFTAQKMDVEGVKSFADIARLTPGVTFDEASHDVAIRGIASTAGSGTTGIYIDDTPIQTRALGFNSNNTLPAIFDLARVEVLRGPQGALFGAGSEGGAIRYITQSPSLTTLSGFGHAEVAVTDHGAPSYEMGAAVGGPIDTGTLGFRLSAWARRDGGWIDRADDATGAITQSNANSVDALALRGALAWAPTDALTVTPSLLFQSRRQRNSDDYWVSLSNPGRGQFVDGTPERLADNDRFVLPSLKIEYTDGPVRFVSDTAWYGRRETVNGYSATLYDLSYFQQLTGAGTDPQGSPCAPCAGDPNPLLLPTGLNLPGFGPYVALNTITNTQSNFTQEFRLQSADPSARLTWLAGVFLGFDTQRSREEINDPQLPALTQYLWGEDMLTAWGEDLLPNGDDYLNDTTGHDRQAAVFAQANYALTDQLKLMVGGRMARTHFDFTNHVDGPQELLDNGGAPQVTTGAKDETPFTPTVGLTWQATPHDLVYATFAEGYRIGGATPPLPAAACGATFPTSYASDRVDSFEVGSKDQLFDRTLQVGVSAYRIQWSHIQQSVYVPACGLQYTTNLGTAVSQGFDAQIDWRPTHRLEVELSGGYGEAKFSADAVATNGDLLARKGDSLGSAPWSLSLGVQYGFDLAGRPAFVRFDDDYTARRFSPIPGEDPATSVFDSGLVPDPALNIATLRAGVDFGRWNIAAYADNLFDAHPQLDLNHQDQFTVLFEARTLRPRTVGLAVSSRY